MSNGSIIPVRWRTDQPRIVAVRLLSDGHPLIGEDCPGCGDFLLSGDKVALVYVGPGPDPEDREKYDASRWHTGSAVAVHERCAG